MSAFRMLLKAGYTMDEAIEKMGRKPTLAELNEIKNAYAMDRRLRAAANEIKYGDCGETLVDRIINKKNFNRGSVFEKIEQRHTCGIGKCKSNLAIQRRIKYGDGRLTKQGYLKTELKMEDK